MSNVDHKCCIWCETNHRDGADDRHDDPRDRRDDGVDSRANRRNYSTLEPVEGVYVSSARSGRRRVIRTMIVEWIL